MAETTLGTAYVQIVPSAKGIKGSISDVLGGEAEAAGTDAGSKIGSFAKKAIAAAAIGTAVVAGVKVAMDEGAKLQQSYFGGLDTLYGEAADAARNYAREAAAAGISMNDYSEQAVSFGAALKSAYGGDTTKAINAANTAIMDMADNSAKMGTDIESVQMAYQGFAKSNYTMLDNLKLGYGGTKTEMERLLKDAEELTGKEYNIDNLGDVYDAIHVIQEDLGLTGVAAEEASETLSGSFGAMKASFLNFMGSLAIGEGVSESLSTLMTSASTFFFGNFLPMLGTIARSIPPAIGTFLQQGLPLLVANIGTMLSSIKTYITGIANNLTAGTVSEWVTANIPKIMSAGAGLIKKLASAFVKNLPAIVGAIGKIGLAIVKGLGSAIWPKITAAANGIKNRFLAPIQALKNRVSGIVSAIKGFFNFNVSMPHIPLPHFSISPSGWKVSDLLKGSIPSLSVNWYAKGGIVDGATLIGAGEAGAEAIVPLDPFWKRLDAITRESGQPVVINVYAKDGQSAKQIAKEVAQYITDDTKRRRLAWQ